MKLLVAAATEALGAPVQATKNCQVTSQTQDRIGENLSSAASKALLSDKYNENELGCLEFSQSYSDSIQISKS